MPTARILVGDVRQRLAELPDCSVQTCVTSPPYWGLRDYGHDGQIGLEQTPDEYVQEMVKVFREVRRVLADDGTLWLNLGDSYATQGGAHGGRVDNQTGVGAKAAHLSGAGDKEARRPPAGLKPKDLIGIPWRVAFALQSDGWWLRQDIIWAKPNPMPESVTDRCTKAHEYVFLFSKSPRYFYDAEAIKEPSSNLEASVTRYRSEFGGPKNVQLDSSNQASRLVGMREFNGSRNRRSVWSIPTKPYGGSHFAVMPEALAEPCILAGSRPPGKRCDCDDVIATPLGSGTSEDPTLLTGRKGMNRLRRDNEGTRPITRREQRDYARQLKASPHRGEMETQAGPAFAHYVRTDLSGARPIPPDLLTDWTQRGWLTTPAPCDHLDNQTDVVLDPFAGSGTVGLVALRHGRDFVGVELNPDYAALAEARIYNDGPLMNDVSLSA